MDLELKMLRGGNPSGEIARLLGWSDWADMSTMTVKSGVAVVLNSIPGISNSREVARLRGGTRVSYNGYAIVNNVIWINITFGTRGETGFVISAMLEPVSGGGTVASSQAVTAKMMSDFGWSVNATELTLVNKVLRDYGITDMRSIRLFFATCAHESNFGARTLERLNLDGTVAGFGYGPNDRGAGYIQLTGQALHLLFLGSDKIKDNFAGVNTAQHIATNYPWQASAWYWSSTSAATVGQERLSLNNYVVRYGDSKGVYLITQYRVRGDTLNVSQEIAVQIRDNPNFNWNVCGGRLLINGVNTSIAPLGWEAPTNGRLATYNSAIASFK
jgi:hypothetical protein